MTARARVMIVEDHLSVADALGGALKEWFDMAEPVLALPSLRPKLETFRPDVILLDLAVGAENSLEWLPRLVREHPGTDFVVLTAYDDHSLMEGALGAGARGFIVKSASLHDIRAAIDTVVSGKIYRSATVRRVPPSRHLAQRPRLPGHDVLVTPTPRQHEILDRLIAGDTVRMAAQTLKVHHRTVEYHLSSLRKKLGGIRREAVLRWYVDYRERRS